MSEISFHIILNCIDSPEMKIILLLLSQNFLWSSDVQNLKIYGESSSISEDDFLQHITRKSTNNMNYITELQRITENEKIREYQFDPTITMTRDISDDNGKIFAKAGEKFNPLDQRKISPILFIDGKNENQVNWALKKINDRKIFRHNFAKIVLIKEAPLDLQIKLQQRIFFDQHGLLTKKLGIKHIPAIVFQNPHEKVLTIREESVE